MKITALVLSVIALAAAAPGAQNENEDSDEGFAKLYWKTTGDETMVKVKVPGTTPIPENLALAKVVSMYRQGYGFQSQCWLLDGNQEKLDERPVRMRYEHVYEHKGNGTPPEVKYVGCGRIRRRT